MTKPLILTPQGSFFLQWLLIFLFIQAPEKRKKIINLK